MTKAGLVRRIETAGYEPQWVPEIDAPLCTEHCRHHDGKRCRAMGFRPSNLCEPAVELMTRLLVGEAPE